MSDLNGAPTRDEVTKLESDENDKTTDIVLPDDEAKKWRTPGLQRLRVEWRGEDRPIIDRVQNVVNQKIQSEFADAYQLIYEIHEFVREPDTDDSGAIVRDARGNVVWKRDQFGNFIEDYNCLTSKLKEHFMFALTTHLFLWQQLAADAWGEAMFAKAQWEERFSIGYDEPRSGTIEQRTARGRMDAREERYFAVFVSLYSRKADALVRSMELLAQRLKDSMTN